MASTITTTITTRVPNEDAAAFRNQAERHQLTPSEALAALVHGALLVEAPIRLLIDQGEHE